MAGRSMQVVEEGAKEGKEARFQSGEGIGDIRGDGFEGSKEENEVFMDVFHGNSHGNGWLSAEHLNHENREPRYNSPDTGDSSFRWDLSKVGSSDCKWYSCNNHQQVSCRVVESFDKGILSSCHPFKRPGEMNVTGNIDDDDGVLHSKCTDHHAGDGKIVMEVKSVNSTASQESSAAGLMAMGGSAGSKETPGTLVCVDEAPQESAIVISEMVDVTAKRAFIRELPLRLQSQAQSLLLDAGWKIEPRKRSDRIKMSYVFIAPEGGVPLRSLCQAWKACGETLLSDTPISEQDENGREWMDIDVFWGDLADALSYIEKEACDAENSMSLLHRWKILDPFMAVVWIDKRISSLRKGKRLRTARSTAFFLHDRKNTAVEDKVVNQDDGHQTKPNSVSHDSLSLSILPAFEPDCKSQVLESACNQQVLAIQGVQKLQKEHSRQIDSQKEHSGEIDSQKEHSGQIDSKPCSYGQIQKISLKSLARRIGKGLYTPSYLHNMSHKISSSHQKKTNRLPSKSSFMPDAIRGVSLGPGMQSPTKQRLDKAVPAFGKDSDFLHNLDFSNHQQFSPIPEEEASMSEKLVGIGASKPEQEHASTANPITSSIKKVRKKSKKISEIEAADLNVKGKEIKLYDEKSRNLGVSDGIGDPFYFTSTEEENNTFMRESTPQKEYLKKQINDVVKSSKSGQPQISVVAEANSTIKKPVKSAIKAVRQSAKNKKGNSNMLLEDEPGGTLLNEGAEENPPHYNSTMGTLSQHKKRSRPKGVPRHRMDSTESILVLNDSNTYMESHSEGSNEVVFPASVSSPGSQNIPKAAKSRKPEVHMENGRKRPRGCRINDDDLLIAAILKKKDFGSGAKRFSSKAGASQSKALGKLKNKIGSCKLLLRTPAKGKDSMDGRRFLLGTKTVLCWLIEMGTVSLKDVVQFRNPKNNEVVKDGWITRDGILCKCCSNILSVSEFKAHAGFKLQKPSLNLFLQSGKPYTLCQFQAWSAEYKARKGHKQVIESEELDRNDDTCGICGDGGELICCDNCPSTYHQACLPSQDLPEGSWYCSNCICKICRDVVNQREASSFLAECSQCEHKYHDICIKEQVACTGEAGSGTWFCGDSCREVYLGLRSRVGVLNNIGDGLSWTILRCSHDDQKVHSAQKLAAMAECNTKLAIALSIMEECFLPMVDPRTGIDMIPQVLYNWRSNFARLNYQGFYTVVLEKDDVIVSVASIRLHGASIVEMPLIATCSEHRRQGMCRRLMNAIEKMLKSFKVKMLVLSAIPNLVDTWTLGFGFKPIDENDKQQLKSVNLMFFPGTSLLKKNLCEEPGPTLTNSPGGKEGNNDLCSREDQSKTSQGFDKKSISEGGQQSVENARIDLDTESFLSDKMNVSVEQVNSQHSCGIPALSSRHHERGDIYDAESFNVLMRTSNTYETKQFLSTEHAVATQMSVANIYTSIHSCSGSPTPTRKNDLPNLPSAKGPLATIGHTEEYRSPNTGVCVMSKERRASVDGDGIEEKGTLVLQTPKKDRCFSDEQTGEGPFLGASNLDKKKLGEQLVDSPSILQDEICGSVLRHPIAKRFTPGNVEA